MITPARHFPLRRPVVLLCTVIAALCLSTSARAQLEDLRTGARVRLRAPADLAGQVEGVIVARHADTVVLALSNAAPVSVPLASITFAEIYRGRDRAAGARKGAIWGAAVGLGLGVIGAQLPDCTPPRCGTAEKVQGGVAIAALSTGVGALVGMAVRAERWERLELPPVRPLTPVEPETRTRADHPLVIGGQPKCDTPIC